MGGPPPSELFGLRSPPPARPGRGGGVPGRRASYVVCAHRLPLARGARMPAGGENIEACRLGSAPRRLGRTRGRAVGRRALALRGGSCRGGGARGLRRAELPA